MTRTTKTAKPTGAAANEAKAAIKDAAAKFQEQIAGPQAARDFVAKQAASAKEGAAAFNEQAEKATLSMIASYAGFTKSMIDMTAANVSHALATAEKITAAKSPTDAIRIQAAFVRDSSKANLERIKDVSETAMAQATATARDAAAKALAQANKLA